MCGGHTFSIVTGAFQVLLLIMMAVSVDYASYDDSMVDGKKRSPGDSNATVFYYSFFQDVHVMIFVGFGFLMTFLKKYSFGAVGYNFFIAALVLQWATLINGWITNAIEGADNPGKILVDLKTLITSDFAAGAVLITFGAVLGKVSRLQLFVIGVFEIIFYAINENLLVHYLKITDVGGSMVIHMFGAYFGLAVTRMLYKDEHGEENENEGSVYHSDVFAMIGTIFLWMFWPSFNAAMLGPGNQQHRAVINTYYSLAACCIVTFVVSPLVHKQRKLDMVHVQNATLAGGVAVGTCADLIIRPWGAVLIGMIAGIISTLGYAYVTPFLTRKLKIHDTCGVHNLHGMPAILAGISGAIASGVASFETYGMELFSIWEARAPTSNSTALYMKALPAAKASGVSLLDLHGADRDGTKQGTMQIAAVFVTLGMAIVGGIVTGLLARFLDAPDADQLYNDRDYWVVPEDDVESRGDGHELIERKGGLLAEA